MNIEIASFSDQLQLNHVIWSFVFTDSESSDDLEECQRKVSYAICKDCHQTKEFLGLRTELYNALQWNWNCKNSPQMPSVLITAILRNVTLNNPVRIMMTINIKYPGGQLFFAQPFHQTCVNNISYLKYFGREKHCCQIAASIWTWMGAVKINRFVILTNFI